MALWNDPPPITALDKRDVPDAASVDSKHDASGRNDGYTTIHIAGFARLTAEFKFRLWALIRKSAPTHIRLMVVKSTFATRIGAQPGAARPGFNEHFPLS
jgi:hypothetical protein